MIDFEIVVSCNSGIAFKYLSKGLDDAELMIRHTISYCQTTEEFDRPKIN